MNAVYRNTPALFEQDFGPDGFAWIAGDDRDNSTFSWLRYDANGRFVISISNFTPVPRQNYRIGVPSPGRYVERLNTDDVRYAGSGTSNPVLEARPGNAHGQAQFIELVVPPLATVYLVNDV